MLRDLLEALLSPKPPSAARRPKRRSAKPILLVERLESRTLLTFSPVGPEFRVNTYTTSYQSVPAAAMDADGDYVIAWSGAGSGGETGGVFAQRYNASGAALGSEFRVNTYTTGSQGGPSVAMDAGGAFVVVWTSDGQDGSGQGVYAQCYDASGAAVGSEFQVNTYTTSDQRNAAAAMNASGAFIVSWTSFGQDGQADGMFAQRYDASGAAVGSEFQVNTYTTSDQRHAAVAIDATGAFIVTWQSSGQDGSGVGVYAQRYDSTGVAQGAEFRVNTYTTNDQGEQSVAMNASGAFVIAWSGRGATSSQSVYAQRYSAAGAPVGTEFLVNNYTFNGATGPSVAMEADGAFVVAWAGTGTGEPVGVFARRFSASGAALGNEFRVNTYTTNNQTLATTAIDADGDLVIAWQSVGQDGSLDGVYAQRFAPVPPTVSITGPTSYLRGLPTSLSFTLTAANSPANSADTFTYDVDWDNDGDTDETLVGPGTGALVSRVFPAYGQMTFRVTAADAAGRTSVAANWTVVATVPDDRLGRETLVNAHTTGAQSGASLAMSASGDFVVVWSGAGAEDSDGVFGRRYDAYGAAIGDAFLINTYTTGSQNSPSVAMDDDGSFVVAWSGPGSGDSIGVGGVFARRYDAAGVALGIPFRVNSYTTSTQQSASIAMDADGDFIVVWSGAGAGDSSGVFAQRYGASGGTLASEFRINDYTLSIQSAASVAMAEGGEFVVVWSGAGTGDSDGVFARRYDAAGNSLAGQFRVNTYTTSVQQNPSVAMDASGAFVVAWTSADQDGSGNGVYLRRHDASGLAQGSEFRVNAYTSSDQGLTSVAMDADGDFVVVWSGAGSGDSSGVFAQRYNATGVPLWNPLRVNGRTTGAQQSPAAAMDDDGDYVIAWSGEDAVDSSGGVSFQRFGEARPGVAITSAYSPFVPISFTLTATNLSANPAEVFTFDVDWDDDGNFDETIAGPAGGTTLAHTYNSLVIPTIRVVATDSIGFTSDAAIWSPWYADVPPQASVNGPSVYLRDTPLAFTFKANNTPANLADAFTFDIDWDDDGVVDETVSGLGAGTVVSHVFNAPGVPTVRATATDSVGRTSAAVSWTPWDENIPPVVSIAGPTSYFRGAATSLTFTVTATNGPANPGDIFTFDIDWDANGTVDETVTGLGTGISVTRLFPAFGETNFRVTATDAAGRTSAPADWIVVASVSHINLGSEFQVNTYTSNSQVYPAVATNASGASVVVWQSNLQDGSSYGIFGQRYDSYGNPVGPEFQVNSYTTDEQENPTVAMNADGDFIVAWNGRGTGDRFGIFAQRYDASGSRLGSEFRVNTYTTDQQEFASVALDDDGDFVIAWYGDGSSSDGAYFQRFATDGTPIGSQVFAGQIRSGTSSNSVSIALDDSGGFVIVRSGSGAGDNYGIYARRYDASGALQGSEIRVNVYGTDDQTYPSVAIAEDGDFVVAWTSEARYGDDGSVFARRFDATGNAQGGEFLVNSYTGADNRSPVLATDSEGNFVIVYTRGDVYARRYNAAGVALEAEFRVNTYTSGDQKSPAVAMDAAGDFFVAWHGEDQDGSGYGVFAQRLGVARPGVDLDAPAYAPFTLLSFTLTATDLSVNPADVFTFLIDWDDDGAVDEAVAGPAAGVSVTHTFVALGVPTVRVTATDAAGFVSVPAIWSPWNPFFLPQASIIGPAVYVPGAPMLFSLRAENTPANPGDVFTFAIDWDGDGSIDETAIGPGAGTTVEHVFDSLCAATVRVTATDTAGRTSEVATWAQDAPFAVVPLGPEFQVNAYTTADQRGPSVATDAEGNFVVVWTSAAEDGDNDGVFAQRYDALGAPLGGPFQVNTYTTGFQRDPSVAVDADGDFVIAWFGVGLGESSGGFSMGGIFAQRYDASGNPVGGEFRVNSTVTFKQSNPSVSMDADGDFLVTWTTETLSTGAGKIVGQRFNALGDAVGGEFQINAMEYGSEASLAMNADGDFVIAWRQSPGTALPSSSIGDVHARRYDVEGVAQGADFRVNTYLTDGQGNPSVAMDVDGNFVVVWSSSGGFLSPGQDGSESGVYAQRFDALGNPLGSEFRVNTYTTNHQVAPKVTMEANGSFIVAWSSANQDGSGYGVFAQRYDASGAPYGSEFRVNTRTTGNQQAPAIAMSADGDAIVVWESEAQDGDGYGIFAQRLAGFPLIAGLVVPPAIIRGAPTTFALAASDTPPNAADAFTFEIDWDNDSVFDQSVVGVSGTLVEHVFVDVGATSVSVKATAADGRASSTTTRTFNVVPYALVENAGLMDLVIGGTTGSGFYSFWGLGGNDVGVIDSSGDLGQFRVDGVTGKIIVHMQGGDDTVTTEAGMNGFDLDIHLGAGKDVFAALGGGEGSLTVYGDEGDDLFVLAGAAGVTTYFHGGEGDDGYLDLSGDLSNVTHFFGEEGNDAAAGGFGDDFLEGGTGDDLLIGGPGADTIDGGSDHDLIISGSLVFVAGTIDGYAPLHDEWRSGAPFATRVAHISGTAGGLNEPYYLTAGDTALDDGAVDDILGGSDEDWLVYNVSEDVASDYSLGVDVRTDLG